MQSLIRFQPVPTIPVTAAFDEGVGAVDVGFDEELVAEEEADADGGEDDVDFSTEDRGGFEESCVGFEGFVLQNVRRGFLQSDLRE